MLPYPSIKTMWARNPATKHKTLIPGEWALPEFRYLRKNAWTWFEKVDGTNIRIMWDGVTLRFGGRTNKAQIPTFLFDKLCELFPIQALEDAFGNQETEVCLYGEGYGAKIQKGGGLYIPNGVSFILFDVKIGNYWLQRVDVTAVAQHLDIRRVPVVGEGTLLEAIDAMKTKPRSLINSSHGMEGLVARPLVQLLDRHGLPVKTKIKWKDLKGV